ncbi:MAG: NEW3 domain-containing protein [Candidatus Kerfeldbacteria bacterium]
MAKQLRRTTESKRAKRTDSIESGEILDRIYRGEAEEDAPTLKKIERTSDRKPSRRLVIAVVVITVLVGSTLAGFLTFNRSNRFNEKGVSLAVVTPTSVTSAGDSTITFTVTNDGSVGIRNVELSVSSPDGWAFKQSDPKPGDTNNTLWQLGTIAAHDKRSVSVVGTLTGEVGNVLTYNASVTYRPMNFNYDFTARASGSVTIASSIIELGLTGPVQASPKATVRYVLTYTNSSSDVIRDLRFTASFPDGFTVATSTPEPYEGNTVWVVNELKSGGTGTITFDGSFSGTEGDSQQLSFSAELKRDATYERQVETSLVVLLVSSTLDVSISVKSQSLPVAVANPGDTLSFEASYTNGSDLEMEDATMTVTLSGGAYSAGSFSDDYGSAPKDGVITWNSSSVPDLASIKPGSTGTIRFALKVPDVPQDTKGANGPTIDVRAAMTANDSSGQSDKSIKVDASPLSVKVVSKTTVSVEPRYYGDQGEVYGTGPLPPMVGKTTVYRMSWYIGNTTNELTNVMVSATVPSTVFWTGKNVTTTAGDVSFDAAKRVVTWALNRMPDDVGGTNPTIAVSFELAVTPVSSDVGASMVLLDAIAFSATDAFTVTTIQFTRDKVTTDLPNDPQAAGKGVVVAAS